jgi:putative DNA primase/helicase
VGGDTVSAWEDDQARIAANADPVTAAALMNRSAFPGEVAPLPPVAFFTDKHQLVPARLGAVVRDAGHVETGTDGRLYRYDGGVYRPDGEVFARARVREYLGDQFRRAHADEVLAWLRSWEPVNADTQSESLLNVTNGLLDWRTGRLEPHTPDVFSTAQLPVQWDPGAACPAIDRFLAEALPADVIELVEEVAGYALYPGNPLRRALLFLGPTATGKSILLRLLRALVGDCNVSAVALQDLADKRFAAAELYGKLANIAGDLDARAVTRSDVFKMATGGDPISAERKFGQPFTFVSSALFSFSANEAPISADQTDAWFGRWLVVPMDRRVPEERVDPKLGEKLTTPGELSGFLLRAVAGLCRVMERGRFAPPKSVEGAGEQYREKLDSVRGFVAEECVVHPEAWVPRPVLCRRYRGWCDETRRLAVSDVRFNDHLRTNYPTQVVERTRRGTRGWGGIGLASDSEER